MERLLDIKDVMDLCRCSYPTLARWMTANLFPQPLNGRGKKLLWAEQQILDWIECRRQQSAQAPPVSIPSNRQQRRKAKDFTDRQEAARQTLERHALGTPNKRKEKQS